MSSSKSIERSTHSWYMYFSSNLVISSGIQASKLGSLDIHLITIISFPVEDLVLHIIKETIFIPQINGVLPTFSYLESVIVFSIKVWLFSFCLGKETNRSKVRFSGGFLSVFQERQSFDTLWNELPRRKSWLHPLIYPKTRELKQSKLLCLGFSQ